MFAKNKQEIQNDIYNVVDFGYNDEKSAAGMNSQ